MGNATSIDNTGKKHQLKERTIRDIYMKSKKGESNLGIKALDLRKMSFSTKSNDCQQLIYVGEGTGDSPPQKLLPLEEPRSETVATDTSQDMVENAKETLKQSQVANEERSNDSDASGLAEMYGKYNRVYSFFVLHWTEDLTAALRNVADLLTDKGECLLVLPARRIVEAIQRFIPSTGNVEDRSEIKSYMLGALEGASLQPRTIQVLTNEQSCLDVDEFIQMMLSLDCIQPLLPEEAKAEFKTDVEEVMRSFWTEELAGFPQFLLDIFVVHAIKI
ncbi:juvenile hormone acid O-methyltransferase [Ixodes scapularis]|uniref:juvenile hormone acid O-methyltransferase n=1 Tax=Ixodes scapularis TaxID=6945 RepID=UPI001A9CC890|nr:juvenile hormone acid O-methyltransferase [Ixodes scapularis]